MYTFSVATLDCTGYVVHVLTIMWHIVYLLPYNAVRGRADMYQRKRVVSAETPTGPLREPGLQTVRIVAGGVGKH